MKLNKQSISKLKSNELSGGTSTICTIIATEIVTYAFDCNGSEPCSDPYTDETAGCSNQCPTTGPGDTIEILY
ncbi:hypothetical protein GTQ40_15875 [Flavobacteriaceae bacterium R38]|nr:hypothetical protein [Flavobacteriaceae bacterium R38]